MSEYYGFPPSSEEIAALVERRLEDSRGQESRETVQVSFRGRALHLDVISMPVAQLYLNPNTHRIRAQRCLDTQRDAVLSKSPWSDEGQLYLRDLLRAKPSDPSQIDPEYLELLEDLRRTGQTAAGVITRSGVLVDANTRCVALRELGVPDIRVGVLPRSADWTDIDAVELRIQLRKDKRREYPYINRLISVEEQLQMGLHEEDVAHEWNMAVKSLKADRWAYQVMLDAIERSKTDDGKQITLLQFNDQQESFREFYRHYSKIAASDPAAAEQLKETRLASLLLSLPKTSLRFIEGDFYTRYLVSRLPENLRPEVPDATSTAIPGLPDDIVVGDDNDATRASRALTNLLLKTKAQINDESNPQQATVAARLFNTADEVFRSAVKFAGNDVDYRKKQTAVPDRITEAADYVNQGADEFAKSRVERTLDEDAFDSALLGLRSSLERLAKQASRAFPQPGEGVEWLLSTIRPR